MKPRLSCYIIVNKIDFQWFYDNILHSSSTAEDFIAISQWRLNNSYSNKYDNEYICLYLNLIYEQDKLAWEKLSKAGIQYDVAL